MAWLEALVLGLVQGITEFLPVSSDGHLLLTENLFASLTGQTKSGKENLFFFVILHLGTTCAILYYHRKSILQGLIGLSGSENIAPGFRRADVVRASIEAAGKRVPVIAGVASTSTADAASAAPMASTSLRQADSSPPTRSSRSACE